MTMSNKKYRNFMATITADRVPNIDHIERLCKSLKNAEYAIIRHDKDIASDHYHIAISYKDPRSINAVAKALKMPDNFIQKWDNRKYNLWAYLTHRTATAAQEKYHYDDYIPKQDKCRSNFDLANTITRDKAILSPKQDIITPICQRILTGELTKRDLLAPDMILIYWQYKGKIDKAMELRTQSLILNPPKCTTLLITGKSGSGKTTTASTLGVAVSGPSGPCWASSPNDPLQDYNGEKCIIFDDFRPQNYDWNDLLALLDPLFRQRTHKSRYYNKPLATEKIILTTVLSLDDIIAYYDTINDEDKRQLRRRIQEIYDTTSSTYLIYDDTSDAYSVVQL